MKLHDLQPQEGSKKDRKRVGQGIAAGQGRTCGRGQKGQIRACWRRYSPLPSRRQPAFLPPFALHPW